MRAGSEAAGIWLPDALIVLSFRLSDHATAQEALLAAANADPSDPALNGIAAFYLAVSLFRQGKHEEARELALAAAAKMKPLPKDGQNALANIAGATDLILSLP
jgi:hypothetical protein